MLVLSNKKNVKRESNLKSGLIIFGFLALVMLGLYLGGARFDL